MASAAEERAEALIAKAQKKLNGMFSFGNGKFEEAAEFYAQAAKQYQLAKNCPCLVCLAAPLTLVPAGAVDKAASCYEQVVEFHNKLGSALEMAMAYKDAGGMYEKAEKPNGAPGRAGPCDWRSMCGGLADPCKLCRVLSVFGGGEEPVRARGSPVRVRQARQAPGRDLREGRDHRSYARLLPRGR
jgi:tetratricopeptide (TPR) repeat protein